MGDSIRDAIFEHEMFNACARRSQYNIESICYIEATLNFSRESIQNEILKMEKEGLIERNELKNIKGEHDNYWQSTKKGLKEREHRWQERGFRNPILINQSIQLKNLIIALIASSHDHTEQTEYEYFIEDTFPTYLCNIPKNDINETLEKLISDGRVERLESFVHPENTLRLSREGKICYAKKIIKEIGIIRPFTILAPLQEEMKTEEEKSTDASTNLDNDTNYKWWSKLLRHPLFVTIFGGIVVSLFVFYFTVHLPKEQDLHNKQSELIKTSGNTQIVPLDASPEVVISKPKKIKKMDTKDKVIVEEETGVDEEFRMNVNQEKGKKLERAVSLIEQKIFETLPGLSESDFFIKCSVIKTVQGVSHEVDVYVEVTHGHGYNSNFIFECKNWDNKKVGKNEIIIFAEKIEAFNSQRGFFVAKQYSKDAKAQAKLNDRITLINFNDSPIDNINILSFHYVVPSIKQKKVLLSKRGGEIKPTTYVDPKKISFIFNGEPLDHKKWINDLSNKIVKNYINTLQP